MVGYSSAFGYKEAGHARALAGTREISRTRATYQSKSRLSSQSDGVCPYPRIGE